MAYTTINKSTDYFNSTLYTGNGGTQTITGVGFQPDFTWVKGRNHAYYHYLQDAVRGSQKILYTNNADSEATITAGISAWNADGYVTGSQGALNYNGRTFAAYNWKAGGGQGSSNTDGSINTTYTSVNTTAGFSISKYIGNNTAGATIGHGLGVAPEMIIVKQTTGSTDWFVYHKSLSATKYVRVNSDDAQATSTSIWNDTAPTSSVFSVGTNTGVNAASGSTYVAYSFAPKAGYSKFGSYVGNGNADGTFVYTGFKPAWLLIKKSSASGNGWFLMDTKTNTYNPKSIFFQANATNAETDVDRMDILSNGFKPRYDWSIINESGATYIYMAFAENPFVGSNNIPATAR